MGVIYYIMGVSGCGKTTIGTALAQHLHLPFIDADDEHSVSNITKMKAGEPLTDEDRIPWLAKVHARAVAASKEKGAVIACSALTAVYRNILAEHLVEVHWIYLHISKLVLAERLANRKNHYMPASLLDSQLATLEEPKQAIRIEATRSVTESVATIMQSLHCKNARIGIAGLGVMGKALARNMGNKGWQISLYNREVQGKEELVAKHCVEEYPELSAALAFNDMEAFVNSLADTQYIFMMLPAGDASASFLALLQPLLSKGAIIIDGANAFYADTEKQQNLLHEHGIHLLGCGVSGGEKGALEGPALMVSGNKTAFKIVAPFLTSIAAINGSGNSCCRYIGVGGSGHYIKMVHNAIEYVEMQLLAEVYALMHDGLQMNASAIAVVFNEWQESELHSYLLGITKKIVLTEYNHRPILSLISDKASSKGTGAWATQEAALLGEPSGMFTAALHARYLSVNTGLRNWVQQHLKTDDTSVSKANIQISIEQLKAVYTLVRVWNHQQGFALISKAAEQYGWEISLLAVADIWRAGCIIRSSLMDILAEGLVNTNMVSEVAYCKQVIVNNYPSLVQLVAASVLGEIPTPIISEAYQSLVQYKQKKLSSSLIQAQRDFFGAHGFQWNDDSTGAIQHFDW